MEDRILRLEGEVSDLKVELAKVATELRTTNAQLSTITANMVELNKMLARGQGAIWALMLFAGAVGAVVTTAIKKALGIV